MSAKLERDLQVGDQVECKPLAAGLPTRGKLLAVETDSEDQYIVQVRPTVLAVVHPEQLLHIAREREEMLRVMSAEL
jgi:hypothetical protein